MRPSSSTAAKAGRSEATTGAPARHRLDEHDAEALAAQVRRDVGVDRAQQRRLVGVGDRAEHLARRRGARVGRLEQLVGVTRARDEQPRARVRRQHRRQGGERHREALARLVDPPEEGEGRRARVARHSASRRAGEPVDLDPLGMMNASPPRWRCTVRRASSETAIRPRIFSSDGRSSGCAACRARERSIAEWKVATTGSVEAHSAIRDADGLSGSWMWSTSNCPPRASGRPGPRSTGPKLTRATEPL